MGIHSASKTLHLEPAALCKFAAPLIAIEYCVHVAQNMDQDQASDIDPSGDVRLVLNAGKLKVSRKALCLSSPVFSAMLGDHSRFKESSVEALDEYGILDLPLEDDDYKPMKTLMKIIHHQNDQVAQRVSFQELQDLAIVCDKYALRKCILPWASIWSQPYVGCAEKDGYESWLFISMAFRLEDIFARITKHIILNSVMLESDTLSCGNAIDWAEGIPDRVMGE